MSESDAARWLAKAETLMKAGKAAEALACFNRTLKIDPARKDALFGKACALVELGRRDEARPIAGRFKKLAGAEDKPRLAALRALLVDPAMGALEAKKQAAEVKKLVAEGHSAAGPQPKRLCAFPAGRAEIPKLKSQIPTNSQLPNPNHRARILEAGSERRTANSEQPTAYADPRILASRDNFRK